MKIEIPEAFDFLFQPARYKGAYGGRGAARSWSFARALLIRAVTAKTRILCCREFQGSIKESVHKLLADQIDILGLSSRFTIYDRSITDTLGSEFIFEGLYQNVNRIKSLEGVDICDIEEAENVSAKSWEILTPTIRKPGSEIWFRFNPQYEDDETYKKFVVNTPDNAIVRLINYDQNPYFPDVLRVEMEQDKARDYALYEHKWLGKPQGAGRKIWTALEEKVHIRSFDPELIASANCFMAMDPHSHYYPACVWVAVIPKNDRKRWPEDFFKHVYAEWPTIETLKAPYHEARHNIVYPGSISDMSREIQAKDGITQGVTIRARAMDTRFAKGSGSAGLTTSEGIVEQFAKRENGGLLFTLPKEIKIDAQRAAIHSDMLYNKHQPISPFNEPTFSVDPSCKNVITSLKNHRLEDGKEKESEKYKDFSDSLRICWALIEQMPYKDLTAKKKIPVINSTGGFQWA